MSSKKLFEAFDSVSAKQWKQKIQFDLKGEDYNDVLVWESLEGISIKPFYNSEDYNATGPNTRTANTSWNIAEQFRISSDNPEEKTFSDAVSKGAESLVLKISNTGLAPNLLNYLKRLEVPLHLVFDTSDTAIIDATLKNLADSKGNCIFHVDPIGYLARTGNWRNSKKEDINHLESIVHEGFKNKAHSYLSVDMSLYQNAGATAVQQLAYGLAHAVEYLNILGEDVSKIKEGTPITFTVSTGGNYFFEIAKLRALRWLWHTIAESYGIVQDCQILALPSLRNKTLYDYNLNMLRTTSECLSAILGGANTVCNLAYDHIYHVDNDFGNRIARNQLVLLKKESYLDAHAGAAEGSYYIEHLTHKLAEKALEVFKKIEYGGGFVEALYKGHIQKKIKESAQKEQQLFDEGKLVLIGSNVYANPDDRMKQELEINPFLQNRSEKTLIEPILKQRLSAAYEQKRLKNEPS